MPKVRYNNITLDSELEMMYYDYLVKNNIDNGEELINKYARQINTHMELSNLVELLNSRLFNLENVNKINLIHISQDLGNNEVMKNTIEEEFGIECSCLLPNGKEY